MRSKRKSILTDDMETCFLCGRPAECVHHVFYGPDRKNADKENLVIPLCNRCHNMSDGAIHFNRDLDLKVKRLAQQAFEKSHTREEFMKLFRRNYL